jgi:hypothetical protein
VALLMAVKPGHIPREHATAGHTRGGHIHHVPCPYQEENGHQKGAKP